MLFPMPPNNLTDSDYSSSYWKNSASTIYPFVLYVMYVLNSGLRSGFTNYPHISAGSMLSYHVNGVGSLPTGEIFLLHFTLKLISFFRGSVIVSKLQPDKYPVSYLSGERTNII